MSAYSIGVDLGGTNLRVAAVDPSGMILERISVPATYTGGPDKVVDEIARIIDAVRSALPTFTLSGVGIGIPGFIDRDSGVVVGSANLPGFLGFPIREAFHKHLGTRIVLENDANAAALGEMWMGAGRDVKDLILITLGTGIGGGIVIGGEVLAGSHGMAGEIGHMTVIPDGNPCGCGNCGCLEKHASATAIAAMGRMMLMGPNITAAGVHQLATEGDASAILIFQSVGKALGIALANMINLFNFPLYLLSGGPLPAWDFFAPAMFAEVRKRSLTYNRVGARIEKALLGADAGLLGAAYLPLQRGIYSEAAACR
ncbi:MAG: ROK family protein [Bryobacteraceae bacterium]